MVDNQVSPTLIQSLTTCIVGGGNSAHVLAPFLAEAGHHVRLLTRKPDKWHDLVYCHLTDGKTGEVTNTHVGRLDKVSSNPADVVPGADVVILCMPVHQYRAALNLVAPFIQGDREVFVGTIYGQGGFNWMVHTDVEKAHDLKNVVTFAVGSIPWICRTVEYGQSVACYGGKKVNIAAVSPADKFDKLNRIFLQDISARPLHTGEFKQACSFLALTLSVDNQIIHPARCYGLWTRYQGRWASASDVPLFYRDCDQVSAENLFRLDAEYTAIRNALRKRVPDRPWTYLLSYLELEGLQHDNQKQMQSTEPMVTDDALIATMLHTLKESPQLAAIPTPTVLGHNGTRRLDFDCRFFTDDIPYGLLVAKSLAVKLQVETPFIDGVIIWAQTVRGEDYLDSHGHINTEYCLGAKFVTGIPEAYGLDKLEDILD